MDRPSAQEVASPAGIAALDQAIPVGVRGGIGEPVPASTLPFQFLTLRRSVANQAPRCGHELAEIAVRVDGQAGLRDVHHVDGVVDR